MKRLLSMLCAVAMLAMMLGSMPLTASAAGKGDYNNDGSFSSTDVRYALDMIVHTASPTQQQLWWCDYDQNSAIDTSDIHRMMLLLVENSSSKTPDYTNPTTTDCWGERSVALLGDSISFGSGCEGEIASKSYAGIVKNAFNAKNGSTNYGFMPAYTTNWSPRSDEICGWPTMTGGPGVTGNAEGWAETDNGNRLMTFGLTAYKQYASLTYNLRSGYNYNYVCVYYHTAPNNGQFVVANNADGMGYDRIEVGASAAKVYDCENTVEQTKRTGFFKVSDFPNGISINIISGDNSPVTITGLGFYNDISGNQVTFNKYTRGGAMLSSLSDTVLSQAASSGTLIMGLGYNDFFWGHAHGYTKERFTSRIDHLIKECNKNGTLVVVNDYLWSNYKTLAAYQGFDAATKASIDEKCVFFRQELKRLANETNGIYVNQEAYWGADLIAQADANDGVHPLNAGHAMMAETLLKAMGLQ
ncbi:MAG: hypothetical protein IJC52_02705 [Clostridia bacterium]|nr:hypothetical protein [Clostridia bacterium]